MQVDQFRILMADDSEAYHALYEATITEAIAAQVSFVTDGEAALARLARDEFDLLVLDLNMPKKNGEEVLKEIRADAAFDTLPIIILTGDTDAGTHERLLELGANDFVEKGAPPDIFLARLKAQRRQKLALDQLTRLAIDMEVFTAGVLHDIRSLETSIMSVCALATSMLQEDPLAHRDQVLADLGALEDKAGRLGDYASRIIAMVRDTQRQLNLEPTAVDETIRWILSTIRPAQDNTGDFTCQIADNLCPVRADRDFLRLALMNIISNAIKYRRPEAPVTIEVSQRADEDSAMVVTCLRDYGLGIPETCLRKVFEPFVRANASRDHEGFGLGLSLVSRVVQAMHGSVWAELPDDGPGTRICLTLPAG